MADDGDGAGAIELDDEGGTEEGGMPSAATAATGSGISGLKSKWEGSIEPRSYKPGDPTEGRVVPIGIVGDKGSGKSVLPSGLPTSEEGFIDYISFDGATKDSVEGFYQDQPGYSVKELRERVRFHDVYSEKGDYPGFSPENPVTGEMCLALTGMVYDDLEEREEPADVIVLDLFENVNSEIGPAAARHERGVGPHELLEMKGWQKRRRLVNSVFFRAMDIAEKYVVVTGYWKDKEIKAEKTVDDQGNEKTDYKHTVQKKKWYEEYQDPLLATLITWKDSAADKKKDSETKRSENYWMYVEDDRPSIFGQARQFNVTGQTLDRFFDEDGMAKRIRERMEEVDEE